MILSDTKHRAELNFL